jgi:hypothetical protein
MLPDLPIISALTALVAVIVSPIVSIYVTRRQIKASIVSTNRQKWIDQLRDHLAELITLVRFLNLHKSFEEVSKEEWFANLQKASLIESKINLLLNPNESDHTALCKTIREALVTMLKDEEESKSPTLVELTNSVLKQSQAILKREWERVKKGS